MAFVSEPFARQELSGQVVNRRYMALVSLVAAFGGLLFGFDLVIISGTVPFFTDFFHLTLAQQGWAVGCINLGSAVGGLLAGHLSDILGRRWFLILCALLFAVTGIGTGWATSFGEFVMFRMLSGVAVGAAALVSPMYIAEMAPASLRGRLVAFYQLAIVTGLLLAYIVNYALLDAGTNNWRWMFSSQAVPAMLFFIGLFFVPESPRWLVKKNRFSQAFKVLNRVGDQDYAKIEMEAITKSFHNQGEGNLSDVFKPGVRRVLIIGCLIAVFSQIGGQNSVLSYAPVILSQTGVGTSSAFAQSVLLGLTFFLFTFVAIGTVDWLGRRKLLLYGSALLMVFLAGLSLCFHQGWTTGYAVLTLMLAFIGTYAATLGPVTWIAISEIFPNRVRGYAMGLATLALWIANFFTTSLFPVMQEKLGLATTFGIHAIICLVYFVFIRRFVPETKGKSLEEIETLLTK
jgi:sugar porter (SP) family MFS transporter